MKPKIDSISTKGGMNGKDSTLSITVPLEKSDETYQIDNIHSTFHIRWNKLTYNFILGQFNIPTVYLYPGLYSKNNQICTHNICEISSLQVVKCGW